MHNDSCTRARNVLRAARATYTVVNVRVLMCHLVSVHVCAAVRLRALSAREDGLAASRGHTLPKPNLPQMCCCPFLFLQCRVGCSWVPGPPRLPRSQRSSLWTPYWDTSFQLNSATSRQFDNSEDKTSELWPTSLQHKGTAKSQIKWRRPTNTSP